MAQAFNLTAQLNLRGPSNIKQIVSDIKKELGTVTGDIKFKIDPSSINNVSKLNQSLQELNRNLSNVTSNGQLATNAIRNFGQSVGSISGSSSKLSNNLAKTAKATVDVGTSSAKAAKNISVTRTEMEEFGRQSALAVRRFAAFSAVTGVFFSLNRAINNGLKSFIEFDRQLVRLQQVTGKNAEGLQSLQDEISRLAIGLGVSSDSLIQVSSTLAQAGLSANDTRAALEALAKSSLAPSFEDINQTVEGSIALMRQFGIGAKDLEKALGSVNSVAAAFAVESGDIISAIQRTGGVFASASKGVSEGTDALNEFIAVFTSVRATTRESAETIATGLRTIFTRIQRQGTIEALREFGVTLTDVDGKFVGAYKAVQLLSEGLNRIDPRDLKFSQIVEELGGFRQIGKVIPLIQQFATAQEALKVAQAGQGSLTADAVKAQQSLAVQISKVREEFLTLIRTLGQSDTFQTLARGALGFASGLIKITGALKGVLPALSILAAGAGLRGLTQFTGGFIGGLKKVRQGGEQDNNQSIAGAIGSNLGASLVGAKTEQVSRDLDQNSVALDNASNRIDSLVISLNKLDNVNSILQQNISSLTSNTSSLDNLTNAINNLNLGGGGSMTAGGGSPPIDPTLISNLISGINSLDNILTTNNSSISELITAINKLSLSNNTGSNTGTSSLIDPRERRARLQEIRNIRNDTSLNRQEKKVRIDQLRSLSSTTSSDTSAKANNAINFSGLESKISILDNTLQNYIGKLQSNSDLLSSNTTSLNDVYSGLVNLANIINSLNISGNNQAPPETKKNGGKILGFAKGGIVPGSGKGDKIPALLEPGEVVMSNLAGNKYGRGNLLGMNRYAAGGKAEAPLSALSSRSDNGPVIRNFQKSSKNHIENNDIVEAKIRKKTFRDYGFEDKDYSSITQELQRQGVKFPIGKQGSSRGKFDARSGSVMETLLRDRMGRGARKYEGAKGYSDISNAPIDIIRGNSIYEVKFKSGSTSDNEILAKLLRYKLETKQNYKSVGFNENKKNLEDRVNLGSITLVHGSDMDDIKGYKSSYIAWLKSQGEYRLNGGGIVQNFMAGGTTTKKIKEVFGTGETTFPLRVRKKYAEEKQKSDENIRSKLTWDDYPKDERVTVDESKVQAAFQQPFDRAKFIDSFKQKITRNTLFSRMSDFAKFIGLPQEDLSVALPLQVDFGGPEMGFLASAQFSKGARGTRPYEGYDLSRFGYGEPQKQELYGLEKLIETKEKEIKKITKTPTRTFDDGSFSFDNEAYSKANDELRELKNRSFKLKDLKREAEKMALSEQEAAASSTGRGTISFAKTSGYSGTSQNSTLYHELTHQLFEGLRKRSENSFSKYRERVTSLFSGDNDDLADAFDTLTSDGGYSSADVVYGRSYKQKYLTNMLSNYYRSKPLFDSDREKEPVPEDITKNLASLSSQGESFKRAREYRPINPKVNQALMTGKYAIGQDVVDRMEDNGKEEFLTTLVQKAPALNQNLQEVLDSTLTELLGGAGIKRQQYSAGGAVQRFMDGGVAQRKVGYIDYDVIANPDNEVVVKKGMEATGMSGPRLYTDHLTKLAVQARKDSSLQKLRAAYGVAGSGKTTLARGQGTDNAKLRQTERFPILTPEDIQKATEVMVLSSSVSKDKLDNLFDATDRTYTLSSTTKEEKERVKSNRISRDITGVGLENRKPGSTASVATDTAVSEALLSDRLGDRSVVLGRSGSGRLRRKQGNELVEVIKKKIGFTWGGYSPMTAGHESIMDAAAAVGIPPEDFIYMVGSNEGITPGKEETYRTAIFDQDTRVLLAKAGAGARGATVLPKPRDFEVPQAFDLSEEGQRRRVLVPAKGSMTFVADKTPEETEKYKTAGYKVKHIERTGGISGTKVRELIKQGNLGELQKVLSPGVYDMISNNIGRIQNRANILPSIIQEVQRTQGTKLADVEKQIKAVGITRIDNKKVAADPEYAAKVEVLKELREKRDQIKSAASFEPHRLLAALAVKEPEKYGLDLSSGPLSEADPIRTVSGKRPQRANIGGIISRFNEGGVANEPKIALSQTSVADTARSNNISLQEAILQHLADMRGIAGVRQIASIPTGDRRISQVLRTNSIKEGKYLDEATGYVDKALSARSNQQRDRTRAIQKSSRAGLLFGAAGVLGTPFAPIKKTVGAGILKSPTDVYVTSGTLQPDTALKLESLLSNNIDRTTRRAAKRVMIDNILSQAGLGKILQLDFDRTLAFGADKISSDDPNASQFAAFSNPQKIQEGLANAKLSSLGKELAQLVAQKPELIDNMRVVTARPQKTLNMVQSWLSSQGLPIPLSQFTGVGGPSVSGSQIAKLKAAVLAPDSIFVDDDKKNIREARKAQKGITTYRYGLNAVKSDANREGTTKGNMFERVIEALGGPKADRSMKGIDFPTGLKSAAKYFGIRGDIPTDAKRTLSGPSTVEDNIVSYLKAKGYKQGGSVGGKASRKVDFASGVGPSPFDTPKTKLDYYSLEKSSGLSRYKFEDAVRFAKTNDLSLVEFQKYLSSRLDQERQKSDLKMNPVSLQQFLLHGTTTPETTKRQRELAKSLEGPVDAEYRPRLAFGGLISNFADGGTVPALVSNGEGWIPPEKVASFGGLKALDKLNQADRNGIGKYSRGGGIGVFKGPGSGTSDSIRTNLDAGGYVLRAGAMKALGFNKGGRVGAQKFAAGGSIKPSDVGATPTLAGFELGDKMMQNLATTGDKFIVRLASIINVISAGSFNAIMKSLGTADRALEEMTKGLDRLDQSVPGLADAIIQNGIANKRSIAGQNSIIVSISELDIANQQLAKSTLEANTALLTNKSNILSSQTAVPTGVATQQPPAPFPVKPIVSSDESQDGSFVMPGRPNKVNKANRALSKAERKARKEQYTAQQRGGVTREEARTVGAIRSDFGQDQPLNPRAEKQKQDYEQQITKGIKDELKSKYQQLYDEEKQAIKAYYTAKAQQAQKEGKDVGTVIDEYKSAVADAKTSMEAALRGEVQRQTEQVTLGHGAPSSVVQERVDTLRTFTGTTPGITEPQDTTLKDASIKTAEALALMGLKAEQNGQTLSQYQNTLKQNLINLAKDFQKSAPQKISQFGQTVSGLTGRLRDTNDKDAASDAKDILTKQLSEISANIDPKELESTVNDLISSIQKGDKSFVDIINSSSNLQKIFNESTSDAGALQKALADLSASTNIPIESLEKLANKADVAASNMYDKNLASVQKMANTIGKASIAIGAFSSALSGSIKMFGGSDNRGSAIASAAVEGFGSTVSTLGATLSQIPGTVNTVLQGMTAMGGGMANMASSIGPTVMGLLSNPITAAVAVVGVAAVGVAAAFKEAHNAAREFDKALAAKNVENAMDRVSQAFDEFSKDMKRLDLLDTIRNRLEIAGANVAEGIRIDAEVPKAMWVNLFDAMGGGAEAAQRSQILDKEGILAYLRSTDLFSGVGSEGGGKARNFYMQRMAPDMAKEQSAQFKPVADATLKMFEEKLRTGTTMKDVIGELKDATGAPTQLAKNIAQANPIIQEQILRIQASNNIREKDKPAMINNIVAQEAEYRARTNLETTLRSMELDKLNRETKKFAVSLDRMFSNMDQSIQKTAFELDIMSRSAELSAAALSGNAKAGETSLKSLNVLKNIDAYSSKERAAATNQASGFFGSQQGVVEPLLGLGNKLEETVLSTINSSIKDNPNKTNEAISSNIRVALDKKLRDLQLPSNIADKLSTQVKKAFTEITKQGVDSKDVSFDEIVEQVPAFAETIASARKAEESAIKALEFYQKNLNDYANAMNQMVDYQIEANNSMRKASEIQTKGNMELSRALGKRVTLEESRRATEAPIKSMTGGDTDPRDIGRNILGLENIRARQQASSDVAANRGPAGQDEFVMMQNRLRNTNIALRENYEALKQMADSTDMAQAAMQKIQEIQAARQAGANLIEKMVTSSPEELARLNASIGRLNNNMRGGLNIGSTSEQRGETLQAFNMLAPMLGDGQKQNELKANVLESMLQESGVGIDSTFQGVLDSLRNPEGDPQMAEAISVYRESINKQTEANRVLGELKQLMANNTAEIAAQKIATSIQGVKLSFESQTLDDIRKGIWALVNKAGAAPVAAGMSYGGIVYASAGQMIDFQPKGTDTVPAMLTPGEFVVNRQATKANLPLLQNINNGYSRGGKVGYYSGGGLIVDRGWTGSSGMQEFGQKAMKEDYKKRKQTALVTTNTYPVLNKNDQDYVSIPNQLPITVNPIFELPSSYFAVNEENGPIGEWQAGVWASKGREYSSRLLPEIKNRSKIKAQFGVGYNTVQISPWDSVAHGANLKFSYKNDIDINNLDKYIKEIGELPNTAFSDHIGLETSLKKLPIKSEDIKDAASFYTKILNRLQKYILLKNHFDESKNKNLKIPNFDSEVRISGGTGGAPFVLSGLASELSEESGLFTKNPEKLKVQTSDVPMLGFEQSGVSGETRLVAGTRSMNRGYYGTLGQGFADKVRSYRDISSDSENPAIKSEIDRIFPFYESVKESIDRLKNEKLVESKQSQNLKSYLASLEALYYKNTFKATFNKGLPFDKDGIDFPITLYNIEEDQWKKLLQRESFIDTNGNYTDSNYSKIFPKNAESFIPINKQDGTGSRRIPWVSNAFSSLPGVKEDMFSSSQIEFEKGENIVRLISSTAKSYSSPDNPFNFTYEDVIGKYYDTISRSFMGDEQKYIVVKPQAETSNFPLTELLSNYDRFLYASSIDALINNLKNNTPIYDLETNTETPSPGEPYKYSLDGNSIGLYDYKLNTGFPSAYASALDANSQQLVIRSSSGMKDISGINGIFAQKYKEQREKNIENAKLNKAKIASGTATGERFDKLSVADKAFPSANRVKIAQEVQKHAAGALGAYGINLPTINKIEDVGGVAAYLNGYQSKFNNKSKEFATVNAWRGFFSELFKPNDQTVRYLKSFGIASDGSNTPQDAVQKIIDREIAISVSKNISGEIPEDILNSNKLELGSDTRIFSVGPDGKKTLVPTENILPKTMADIEKIALNPQNIFENETKRKDYLDVLRGFWDKNKTKYPGNIADNMIKGIDELTKWYGAQDILLNTGLKEDALGASLSELVAQNKEGKIIAAQKDYEPYNKLLTAQQYGALPNTEQMMNLVRNRQGEVVEEAKKQQTEQKTQKLATGGLVYASNGTLVNFQPRGTDTVPAMLTPGEFVINRDSTQKYRPVLEAINNGNYSRGGIVNYLSNGGYLPLYRAAGGNTPSSASFDFTKYLNGLAVSLTAAVSQAFDNAINNLKQPNNGAGGVSTNNGDIASIDNFVNRLNNIANILSNIYIPPQITITGKHDVNVTINGDTVLNQLRPDIAGIVVSAIKGAFRDLKAKNPENNTINFDIDINPSSLS